MVETHLLAEEGGDRGHPVDVPAGLGVVHLDRPGQPVDGLLLGRSQVLDRLPLCRDQLVAKRLRLFLGAAEQRRVPALLGQLELALAQRVHGGDQQLPGQNGLTR